MIWPSPKGHFYAQKDQKQPIFSFFLNTFFVKTLKYFLLSVAFFATFNHVFAQWPVQNLPATALPAFTPQIAQDNSVWFTTIHYVGNPGAALPAETLRSTDDGQTFKKGTIIANADDYLLATSPVDASIAFMVAINLATSEYFFQKTTDAGETWNDMPFTPISFPDVVHFWTPNDGLIVSDPDALGVYIGLTHDGGNTFTRLDNANLPKLGPNEYPIIRTYDVIGDAILLPINNFEDNSWRICRSLDRGQTWTIGESFFTTDVFNVGMAFTDVNHGMVRRDFFENSKKPLFTEDGGMTWHEAHADLPGYGLFALDNVPGTQNVMAFFYNPTNKMVFSALTNDLGYSWNTFRDIAPGVLDSIYTALLGVEPFVFSNLAIQNNHHAWGSIDKDEWRKYSSTTPLVPEIPDLELSMTADNPHLDLYSSQKFTLTVRNRGIATATKVQIKWLPPYKRTPGEIAPFALQAGYANNGHFNEWDGIWDIPELAPGQSGTATYHLFVLQNNQNVTQTAQITACTQQDIDSQVNNMVGAADEDDEVGYVSQSFSPDDPPIFNRTKWMEDVAVAPNPAVDFTEMYFDLPEATDVLLELADPFGRIIWSKQLIDVKNGVEPIDLTQLPSGVYSARYTLDGEKVRVKPFVVQKSF
jgi:photosystem II stability/assembly factor-like uncharacterized protein